MSNQETLKNFEAAIKAAKKAHTAEGTKDHFSALQKAQGDLVLYFKGEQIIDDDPRLHNLTVVYKYLDAAGWKTSRASVATHNKEGAINPDEDGRYPLRRVLKYAENYLLKKDGSTVIISGSDAKAKAVAKQIEAATENTLVKTAILKKEWVSRERVEIINSAKSTLLKNSFKNLCHTRGFDIAREFGISASEHSAFATRLFEELENELNIYSEPRKFWVEVLADD